MSWYDIGALAVGMLVYTAVVTVTIYRWRRDRRECWGDDANVEAGFTLFIGLCASIAAGLIWPAIVLAMLACFVAAKITRFKINELWEKDDEKATR